VLQNVYKLVNQKSTGNDAEVKRKEIEIKNLLKKTFPELNLVSSSSNIILTAASSANSNHNQQPQQYSFVQPMMQQQPQQQGQLHQQSPQQTNKILITSSPSQSSTSNIAIAVPIQDILASPHNKIQILSASPSANNQQQHQQSQQITIATNQNAGTQQQQQHQKTVNMLSDTDKNRIFYNIKQARGTQILTTHLHPATKVVSILPIHTNTNKNATQQQHQQQKQTLQNIVQSNTFKPQNIQKLTINNSQNLATLKHHQQQMQLQQQQQQQQIAGNLPQQSNTNSDTQQQQQQNSIKIIQTTNDTNKPVTRINVNTTNR
jgi:hypothetical protein